MANRKINTTELDFDRIKLNLKSFLSAQTEFQDYDFDGSGLSILMDVLAYNTHYNALYNNLTINEMFLDSASKRSSVVSLARMLGYNPRSCISAIAKLRVTVNITGDGPSSLAIPAYTPFETSVSGTSYTFYTRETYVSILTGSQYIFDIDVIEGSVMQFNYSVESGARYLIQNANADLTTLKVKVQDNPSSSIYETYTNATSIVDATSTTKVYFVKELDGGLYEITFGNGIIGKKLSTGNVVHIEYMISSLELANFARLFSYQGHQLLSNSTLSIACLAPATGGSSIEDIDSIRFNAPRAYAAQNRAVTPDDYKNVIYQALPETKSVSVWGGEDNVPPVYGKIFICVKPKNATKLTNQQKINLVSSILLSKNVVSVTPEIVDPEYISLSLSTTVYYNERETNRTASEIESIVRSTILQYDYDELQRFDGIFRFSKLSKLIDGAEPGITNNITTVSLRRKINPRYNVSAQYLINLINPIFYPGHEGGAVSSTGVYIKGSNELHYIDDNGVNLRLFKYNTNGEKLVVNSSIGTIDHVSGILDIRNLNITALTDRDFEISIKPASNDVVSALTQIVEIANEHLTIKAIADKSANGDLRAGFNYKFTNSSA